MTIPPHANEHHELLQLLAKATEDSKLIDHVVLVTIGYDGRPCVGGSIPDANAMLEILSMLGAAKDSVRDARKVDMPGKSN